MNRLHEAEEDALDQVGHTIAAKAKAKAPVRKIYAESKRRRSHAANHELVAAAIRFISTSHRLSERQKTEALYLLQRHPEAARVAIRRHGSVNRRRPHRLGRFKEVSLKRKGNVIVSERVFRGVGTPLLRTQRGVRAQRGIEPDEGFSSQLSARGRYEVRSGRAFTNEAGELVTPGSHPTQVNVGGHLKASITVGAVERDGTRTTVQVAATAPYAKFVEFPTRHNAAQPFLLPALHEEKRSLGPALANELRARGLKG